MSDQGEPAPEPVAADEPKPAAAQDEKPADGAGRADRPEQPEPNPFDRAGRNPLGGAGGTGGFGTAYAARQNFAGGRGERSFDIGGDSQYFEGNYFFSQFGGAGGAGSVLVSGQVPEDELKRLADIYCEATGYQRMKTLLRRCGLLVLCGEPGSGRTATALALLAELTGNQVHRLDPAHPMSEIKGEDLTEGHGYLLKLERDDGGVGGGNGGSGGGGGEKKPENGRPARPTAVHLDRLSGLLAGTSAYGIVLAESGDLADQFLRGRYGMLCPPPLAESVLRSHLRILLKDEPEGAVGSATALRERADVKEALGLDELRPREAARLAGHLAARQRGELTDDQLLDSCATFVRAQAREWFAGADRPGTLPEAMPALSAAAFRIAVAVFNGSSYSLTAEAGEQLAWDMAVTLDPENPVGRRLFGTRAEDRPALARSVLLNGELDLGDAQVPVRVVRFQGEGLATAVLDEVWHGYHNVRGPVSRWLRALCDDPRPQLWVRASIAAGVLCSWDWVYGSGELIHPMAALDSPVLRMSAATALAEASREPAVQPAVMALLKDWAQGDNDALLTTAVLAHGYGMAAGSVAASLDALGKLARKDDGEALPMASFSVTRLLAGTEPRTVTDRLGAWLRDGRRELTDLVLLTVITALKTRTTYLWGLQEVPALLEHGSRPLMAALLATRPQSAEELAALVRHTLATARSGEVALTALGGWLRPAAEDEGQLGLACGFLSLLAVERRDRDRLRHLLARLVRDPDEPLDKTAARRMWDAVGEGADG